MPAAERYRRAAAAECLLALQRAGALDDVALWSWERLDALPAWCLLPTEKRCRLQRVAGAVFLLPELRSWIDAGRIRVAVDCLGSTLFAALVECTACPDPAVRPPPASELSVRTAADRSAAFETHLMRCGAAVLYATLDAALPSDRLLPMLGRPAGELPPRVAWRILGVAAHLIADDDSAGMENLPA